MIMNDHVGGARSTEDELKDRYEALREKLSQTERDLEREGARLESEHIAKRDEMREKAKLAAERVEGLSASGSADRARLLDGLDRVLDEFDESITGVQQSLKNL